MDMCLRLSFFILFFLILNYMVMSPNESSSEIYLSWTVICAMDWGEIPSFFLSNLSSPPPFFFFFFLMSEFTDDSFPDLFPPPALQPMSSLG